MCISYCTYVNLEKNRHYYRHVPESVASIVRRSFIESYSHHKFSRTTSLSLRTELEVVDSGGPSHL